MKLFKSLLVAPATVVLLAPSSGFAGEANLNDINTKNQPYKKPSESTIEVQAEEIK